MQGHADKAVGLITLKIRASASCPWPVRSVISGQPDRLIDLQSVAHLASIMACVGIAYRRHCYEWEGEPGRQALLADERVPEQMPKPYPEVHSPY